MNFEQDVLTNWLDENLFVKCWPFWKSSGNGIAYTSIFMLLGDPDQMGILSIPGFVSVVGTCSNGGCLRRTPDNKFGQESYDDYLFLFAALIKLKRPALAKDIMWYGVRHLGFYNTTGSFTWSAWLWRFPHVFMLGWCAAYPWLRWIFMYPLLFVMMFILRGMPKPEDQSGTQLAWGFYTAVRLLFNLGPCEIDTDMATIMTPYYSQNPEHPFIQRWRELAG